MLCKLFLHSYLTCFVNNLVADVRLFKKFVYFRPCKAEKNETSFYASSSFASTPTQVNE